MLTLSVRVAVAASTASAAAATPSSVSASATLTAPSLTRAAIVAPVRLPEDTSCLRAATAAVAVRDGGVISNPQDSSVRHSLTRRLS
jgi:hypothetical protein